jgi:ribose transport system permease protein
MLSGMFAAPAGIVLVGYSGQPTLGMGDPFLFQPIAAIVIGGVSILGGRGHFLSRSPVVSRSSRCSACCGPKTCRSVLYGLTILVILLAYGGNDAPPDPTPSIHDASIVGFAR